MGSTPTTGDRVFAAVRTFGLLALWGLTAFWMVRDNLHDPYNPNLTGTSRYGHNHQGALQDGLLFTLIELLVLYAILRPWRTRQGAAAWGPPMLALGLLVPWLMMSAMMSMHAGGIIMIHLMWLFLIGVALLVAIPVALIRARRRAQTPK